MNASDPKRAVDLLNQLLRYTSQISSFEQDPGIDVELLASRCRTLLDELSEVMSHGGGKSFSDEKGLENSEESKSISELLDDLNSETHRCIERLKQNKDQIENELLSLQHAKKAVRAYKAAY